MTQTNVRAGRANNGKKVHYFNDNNRAICNQGPHLDELAPDDWDPNHPDTCPKCRERLKWFKRGFRKVNGGSYTVTTPKIPSHT